jgi:hypothetical protein
MPELSGLTGHWVGHYMQRNQPHPIVADLVDNGGQLSGTMRDGEPDNECSVFDAAAYAGLPPGADEQIEAGLRRMLPDSAGAAIRYVSHLPEDSVIEGRRSWLSVSFVKRYQGVSFGGYRVGDKILGIQDDGHSVRYQGELNSDGSAIEGRWSIDADPAKGSRGADGTFVLRRAGLEGS